MVYAPKRGNIVTSATTGNKFNAEMQTMLSRLKPGDRLIIDNIRVQKPDGTTTTISISYRTTS